LCHIEGNANGLRNLFLSARSGVPLRMYSTPTTRDANIEAGMTRPAEVILAEAIQSAHCYIVEAHAMPEEAWSEMVTFSSGRTNERTWPADRYLFHRLLELEIHHIDLGTSYTFADTPEPVAEWFVEDLAGRRRIAVERGDDGQWIAIVGEGPESRVCRGSAVDLAAWFSGRTSGAGIHTDAGELPRLSPGLS
jgi:maleylpyruvate isomerase